MGSTANQKLGSLLFGVVLSLTVGLLFASFYATARHGMSAETLSNFDVFAFWYETPLYLGYVTPVFYHELMIVGGTAVVCTLVLAIFLFRKIDHHGSARWGRFGDMRRAGYLRRYSAITGPIFGKTTGPRWLGYYLTNGDQPHSLVVAPTRAGKGVGVVIPTLLTFNGSILALDVKGELFELTSRARRDRGDLVFKFAPLDRDGRTNSYNPVLDIVNLPPERQFSETRRLAVNLIASKGKGAEGFIDGARDLFVAGILACIERGTPTIGAVYDLFAQPGEKYKLFAKLAEECQNKEAQRIFDNMAGNDTKILTSYTSVLGDGGLNLWADPLIKAATTTSDFSIYDLRRDPTSIFLCVSPNDLEVIAPLIRLFFQQIVSILQRSMPGKDEIFEVLFLLDEFKHLGKLESIETAVTTMAGYKGRFMFIIQSLAALTGAYEESGKENFLSNTGVQIFMATADDDTPNYISKSIGDYTYKERNTSYSQSNMFDTNIQLAYQGAPLLRPEQVRLIDDSTQIVLIKGQPPLLTKKVKYYSDRVLKRIFESQTGPLPEPEPIDTSAEYALPDLSAPTAEPSDVHGTSADIDPFAQMAGPVGDTDLEGDDPQEEEDSDEGGDALDIDPQDGAGAFDTPPPQVAPSRDEPRLSEEEARALAAQQALLERIIALQQRGAGRLDMGRSVNGGLDGRQ
jgi:type IV secretion system protein VirD4